MRWILALALSCLLCFGSTAQAELSVASYGAIPDDGMDDTAAFVSCATALAAQTIKFTPATGSGEATYPAIKFPAGTYVVTSQIDWGPYARLIADGSVCIQSNAGIDAFLFEGGFNVRLDGFTFVSGRTPITFRNNNANGGRLQLDSCRFQATTGPTIWAGPNTGTYFSSHVTIDQCKWFSCAQVIVTWADVNAMTNCWIQWKDSVAAANTSCLEVRGGRLNLTDTMLVPVFPMSNYGCTWVGFWSYTNRSGGSGLFCKGALFHGEFGGLPVVYMAGVPDLHYPFQGPSITFRDCQLSCGQTSRADTACIQLASGMPQTVTVDGSTGILGPCPLIWDRNGDGETVLASLENGAGRVRYLIEANVFYPLTPPVPTFLTTFVRTVAP